MPTKYTTAQAMEVIRNRGLVNMTTDELKEVLRPMLRTAKERLRRLEQAGLKGAPAYRGYAEDTTVNRKISKQSRNKLVSEAYEAFTFLNAETSTVKGARKNRELIEGELGREMTDDEITAAWGLFHYMQEHSPATLERFEYSQVLRQAATTSVDPDTPKSLEDRMNQVRRELGEIIDDYSGQSIAKSELPQEKDIWSHKKHF